ncbi:IS66 family transposase [Rhodanobacter terrae]|uniref:IS66 family transposase n=1 Tax=Rhodanobacter terrae TaxID=418647 RepID=A0ABW0T1F0_9GAMM
MDVQTLSALVADQMQAIAERDTQIAQQVAVITRHERTITEREARISVLTAEIARLRRAQFAARSEKMDPAQRALFEETMAADIAAVEAELEALQSPAADERTKDRPRQAPKRRPLPEDLERVTRYEPSACTCGRCGGELAPTGDHVSEKLSCKPLQFFVRRDVYPQYACRACETIAAVPVASTVIDRGIAAPDLLAQVLVAKYLDHLPLYRQEAICARRGIAISRSTLAEWLGACGVALQPLVGRMRDALLSLQALHADETPVGMLEPGRGKTHRSYLFAYRSGIGPSITVFDFCTSRSGQHARRFLGDYQGALMVDDYVGYKAMFAAGMAELGCWAHARRKFVDQHKASGSPIAREAIERIAVLYRIEAEAKRMSIDDRGAYRQNHAVPALQAIKTWLDDLRPQVAGNSGAANAIDYTLRRWPALAHYADDGAFPIDNNPIENGIRPIVLGRKNWLFAGSETVGQRAAAIMSLLATAKANGHEPQAWLTDGLTRLPTTKDRDIDTLLPLRNTP